QLAVRGPHCEATTTKTKEAVLALSEKKEKIEENGGGAVGWRRE
uniref:Uncharacterized protein n=1 Tax=Cucumis melo TaxID=3656 RepID=A0A9I9E428_CUCME